VTETLLHEGLVEPGVTRFDMPCRLAEVLSEKFKTVENHAQAAEI
jgi:hypothetical protein